MPQTGNDFNIKKRKSEKEMNGEGTERGKRWIEREKKEKERKEEREKERTI